MASKVCLLICTIALFSAHKTPCAELELRWTKKLRRIHTRHLTRKLQLPLNRLEARLFAQGIQERVGLHVAQARIP
jgi:hypothetical protein